MMKISKPLGKKGLPIPLAAMPLSLLPVFILPAKRRKSLRGTAKTVL